MFLMDHLLALVSVILSVAFFTLMERKIMGITQIRKGPNKVSKIGILQPMADGLKLLTKESMTLMQMKKTLFLLGPLISFMGMLLCWSMYNFKFNCMSFTLKILIIITILSMMVYPMIMMSWGSNSKYSLMGGFRTISQVVSYELSLMTIILVVLFMFKYYKIQMLSMSQENLWVALSHLPLFFIWITVSLAETNRTPFDLSEGESEIVSGFNIEYSGGLFALIFISEYGMIMMASFLTTMLFLNSSMMILKMLAFAMLFIVARCSYPRLRYDTLMMCSWKMILPAALIIISLSMMT